MNQNSGIPIQRAFKSRISLTRFVPLRLIPAVRESCIIGSCFFVGSQARRSRTRGGPDTSLPSRSEMKLHDPEDPALYPGNRTFSRQQGEIQESGQTATAVGMVQPCGGCIGILLISRAIFTREASTPQGGINFDCINPDLPSQP